MKKTEPNKIKQITFSHYKKNGLQKTKVLDALQGMIKKIVSIYSIIFKAKLYW